MLTLIIIAGLEGLAPAKAAPVLTRAQAVTALFAPGSGVAINTNVSPVWLPTVSLGFGAGFEGVLPAGTTVGPRYRTNGASPDIITAVDSYLFWVDDLPGAEFAHPTRFVLVKATVPAPTVGNGGITATPFRWWPMVTLPGGSQLIFFATSQDRTTSFPAGAANPNGLAAGYAPARPVTPPFVPQGSTFQPAAGSACGLIVVGSPDQHMRNAADTAESDLKDHHGVPAGRIVKVNNGGAASFADLVAAITQICLQDPPCDKIFVRLISHGDINAFVMSDGLAWNTNLCKQFEKLGAKGVPICMMINSCFSGSLLDAHDWNFPDDSVIITSADATHESWGGYFKEVTNSLWVDAFSKCLRQFPTNSEIDAYRWVTTVKPCYIWTNNTAWYPAGASNNPAAPNPGPQIRTVGRQPLSLNANVCNGSGATKTDFHIVFKGDVRGGLPRAWRSDANDNIGPRWAENGVTVTYDAAKNETMVSWQAPSDPVAPGQYIHFGFASVTGGLQVARKYWTPTTATPAIPDRVPTRESSVIPGLLPGERILHLVSRGLASDGWGGAQGGQLMVRFSPTQIPLDQLSLNNPLVQAATPIFTGGYSLQPDVPMNIPLNVPVVSPPGSQLIVMTMGGWSVNQNQVIWLDQIPLTAPLPPPVLSIRFEDSALILSWPAAYSQYNAIQALQLPFPSELWQPVPAPRERVGDHFEIRLENIPPNLNLFFQLRSP